MNLYREDFVLWLETVIRELEQRNLKPTDSLYIARELDKLKEKEKYYIEENTKIIISNLLRYHLGGGLFLNELYNTRRRLAISTEKSPSLNKHLRNNLNKLFEETKKIVVKEMKSSVDKLPKNCPYTIDNLLDTKFFG